MKKFTKVFSSALVLLMMVGLLPWCGMTAYASGGATYTIKPYDADYDNINYGTLSTDTGLPYDTMVSTLVRKTGGNGLGSSYNIKSVEITSGSNATLGTATGTPGQNGYDVPVVINAVGKFVLTIKRTSGWDALHIGVNVRNNTDVESVSLDETEINITLGEDAVSLSATVLPAIAEQNVTWASSDTSVATVENGVVTAVAPGTAIITATATNGTDDDTTDDKTATCTVTVVLPSASVTTAPTAKTLTYDKSAQALVAAGTAENGVMQYATSENGPFSPDIPTVTNAGTYNVWYKAKGNEGYNDSDVAGPVEVTIAKADPEVPDVQLSAKVGQTLSELELPDGWAWDAPSTALTEPGDKTFPASVTGNTNYNDKTADLPVAVSFEIENTFGNGGKHTKDKDDSLLFVFEIAGLDADTYPVVSVRDIASSRWQNLLQTDDIRIDILYHTPHSLHPLAPIVFSGFVPVAGPFADVEGEDPQGTAGRWRGGRCAGGPVRQRRGLGGGRAAEPGQAGAERRPARSSGPGARHAQCHAEDQCNGLNHRTSVSLEDIPGINLILNIIQDTLIAVGYDGVTTGLECLKVINYTRTEESSAVRQRRLIDDDLGALGLYALHDTLDGTLAEVVRAGLHRQAIDTDCYIMFAGRIVCTGRRVISGLVEHAVGDVVLARAVALHDSFDQVLGNIVEIGKKLLGILGKAVAAVAERRVVVVSADARVSAYSADNGLGIKPFHLSISIQFVEERDAESKVRIGEERHCLGRGRSHEKHGSILLERSLMDEAGKGMRSLFEGRVVIPDYDAGRIEVVIKCLGLPEELWCEDDPGSDHPHGAVGKALAVRESFARAACIPDRNSGLDDHHCVGIHLQDHLDDLLDMRGVEEILLGVVVRRGGDDDEVRASIGGAAVERGCQVQRDGIACGIGARQVTLDVVVLDGAYTTVEQIDLFRNDIHGRHMVALREKRGDAESHITGSCYCNIHVFDVFETNKDTHIRPKSQGCHTRPEGTKKERQKVSLPLCAPLGARTLDTLIKSQVLYQLS